MICDVCDIEYLYRNDVEKPRIFLRLVFILGRKLVVGSLDEARCSDKDSDLGIKSYGGKLLPFFFGS